MNIGLAIKSIRKKLSITQYELAEKCDLSQTSLSQIETGVKRPSQRTITKVCMVLDIPESIIYIVAMQEAAAQTDQNMVSDVLKRLMATAEREIDERNRPLTDDELDAMFPEGYKVPPPPFF